MTTYYDQLNSALVTIGRDPLSIEDMDATDNMSMDNMSISQLIVYSMGQPSVLHGTRWHNLLDEHDEFIRALSGV